MGLAVGTQEIEAAPRMYPARQPASWIWLAPAALLLPFANGTFPVALAAWLAPIFLLRFVRTRGTALGLLVGFVLLAAAGALQFHAMIPFAGVWPYAVATVFGVPMFLPYALDRCFAPRLGGWGATLVFPASWARLEYFLSLP